MPSAVEMMKRREEEILKIIQTLNEQTQAFTNPKLILIGGYALRAFIPFSRFTRDCDFMVKKANGWNLDKLKGFMPESYDIENEEKHETYGFMRLIKMLQHNRVRIKVSLDLMEGEIRGRRQEEVILIDDTLVQNSKPISLTIAEKEIDVLVPSYLDYIITKIVSSRASDIRDIAALIHENGVPPGLIKRAKQILPYPRVLKTNLEEKIIPEIRKPTFLNSWRGIFATRSYTERDQEKVLNHTEKILSNIRD